MSKNFLKDFLCVLFFLHGHYEYQGQKGNTQQKGQDVDFSAVMKNLPLATTILTMLYTTLL